MTGHAVSGCRVRLALSGSGPSQPMRNARSFLHVEVDFAFLQFDVEFAFTSRAFRMLRYLTICLAFSTFLAAQSTAQVWRRAATSSRALIADASLYSGGSAHHYAVIRHVVFGNGGEVLESTDSGRTWRMLQSLGTARAQAVARIGDTVLVATTSGPDRFGDFSGALLRSTDGGLSWADVRGDRAPVFDLARTTDTSLLAWLYTRDAGRHLAYSGDCGKTWLRVDAVVCGNSGGDDPHRRPERIVTDGRGRVFVSDMFSTDGGVSWSADSLAECGRRVVRAVDGETRVYGAAVGYGSTGNVGDSILIVKDGLVIVQLVLPLDSADMDAQLEQRTFLNLGDSVLLVGGVHGLYRAERIGEWGWQRADDRFAFWDLSAAGDIVLAATDGGLLFSDDQGATWSIGAHGLRVNSGPQLFFETVDRSIWATGIRSTDDGRSWEPGLDLSSVAPMANRSAIGLSGAQLLRWSRSAGWSPDSTFRSLDGEIVRYVDGDSMAGVALVRTSHGSYATYRSGNWVATRSRDSGASLKLKFTSIVALREQLFAGTQEIYERDPEVTDRANWAGAGLYLSLDNGTTWAERWGGGPVADLAVTSYELLVVSTDVGVMTSSDRGFTWTNVLEQWNFRPIRSPRLLLLSPSTWIVGASETNPGDFNGILLSVDSGSTWRELGDGLEGSINGADPSKIHALYQTSTGRILAGTQAGPYYLDLTSNAGVEGLEWDHAATLSTRARLNLHREVELTFNSGSSGTATVQITNPSGQSVYRCRATYGAGATSVTIEGTLPSGTYLVSIRANAGYPAVHRVAVW
jgi:photosystem II stability/assembly factor-like uncharacterized protein